MQQFLTRHLLNGGFCPVPKRLEELDLGVRQILGRAAVCSRCRRHHRQHAYARTEHCRGRTATRPPATRCHFSVLCCGAVARTHSHSLANTQHTSLCTALPDAKTQRPADQPQRARAASVVCTAVAHARVAGNKPHAMVLFVCAASLLLTASQSRGRLWLHATRRKALWASRQAGSLFV
jgi:hypothetical protein